MWTNQQFLWVLESYPLHVWEWEMDSDLAAPAQCTSGHSRTYMLGEKHCAMYVAWAEYLPQGSSDLLALRTV